MQRELNPDLFGEKRALTDAPAFLPELSTEPHFLDVDRQIHEIKAQIQRTEDISRQTQAQWADSLKGSHLKLERLQQMIARLENSHNGLAQEVGSRLSQMQQRIIERASYDEKTQEMIDRHNHVIKSFEVRMNQMQKLIQEKELVLNSTLQALNDCKHEIARLKRL